MDEANIAHPHLSWFTFSLFFYLFCPFRSRAANDLCYGNVLRTGPGRLGRCRKDDEEATYILAFENAGRLRTAKARSIYTRHCQIGLDYCKDGN